QTDEVHEPLRRGGATGGGVFESGATEHRGGSRRAGHRVSADSGEGGRRDRGTQRIEVDRAAAGHTGFREGSGRDFAAGPAVGPGGLRAERFYEGGTEGVAVLDRGRGGRGRDDRQTRDNRRD